MSDLYCQFDCDPVSTVLGGQAMISQVNSNRFDSSSSPEKCIVTSAFKEVIQSVSAVSSAQGVYPSRMSPTRGCHDAQYSQIYSNGFVGR